MRRLLLIFVLVSAAIVALSMWQPGDPPPPAPTATATFLPNDYTILPTFVPSFPCDLQNVELYDEKLCRYETVAEQVIVSGDGVNFFTHDYHVGQGCWSSINQDTHELRVCNHTSGAVTTLTQELVTVVIPSPDGAWLAFGTMNRVSPAYDSLDPHVYRVRIDGTRLQKLDAVSFPDFAVGAPRDLRWLDDAWLAFALWDGTGDAGWHPYRLKADGSGVYEALPSAEATEAA